MMRVLISVRILVIIYITSFVRCKHTEVSSNRNSAHEQENGIGIQKALDRTDAMSQVGAKLNQMQKDLVVVINGYKDQFPKGSKTQKKLAQNINSNGASLPSGGSKLNSGNLSEIFQKLTGAHRKVSKTDPDHSKLDEIKSKIEASNNLLRTGMEDVMARTITSLSGTTGITAQEFRGLEMMLKGTLQFLKLFITDADEYITYDGSAVPGGVKSVKKTNPDPQGASISSTPIYLKIVEQIEKISKFLEKPLKARDGFLEDKVDEARPAFPLIDTLKDMEDKIKVRIIWHTRLPIYGHKSPIHIDPLLKEDIKKDKIFHISAMTYLVLTENNPFSTAEDFGKLMGSAHFDFWGRHAAGNTKRVIVAESKKFSNKALKMDIKAVTQDTSNILKRSKGFKKAVMEGVEKSLKMMMKEFVALSQNNDPNSNDDTIGAVAPSKYSAVAAGRLFLQISTATENRLHKLLTKTLATIAPGELLKDMGRRGMSDANVERLKKLMEERGDLQIEQSKIKIRKVLRSRNAFIRKRMKQAKH